MNVFPISQLTMAQRPILLRQPEWRLTTRDLMALAEWIGHADTHGYRRLLIEAGDDTAEPEDGGYALVYAAGRAWANWGLARCETGIAVWHCGTGADVGCFRSMMEALESLPHMWTRSTTEPTRQRAATASASNVVQLRSIAVRQA